MKVTKTLKNIAFEYDDKKKTLTIKKLPENGAEKIEISKVHMFSLMRFWIRIAQKEFRRRVVSRKESWTFFDDEHKAEEFLGSKEEAIEYFAKKYKKDKEYVYLHLTPF